MSNNQIDSQLQAIEQELFSAPLPKTLEVESFEPLWRPKRKRSLLTRVRRQYDRLDNKYQLPLILAVRTFRGVVGSKYTHASLVALAGFLLLLV